MILSDQARETYIHMLTERMRWARKAEKAYLESGTSSVEGEWETAYPTSEAADAEVRSVIREVARMCRFDNTCVDEITGAAWSASKEDN